MVQALSRIEMELFNPHSNEWLLNKFEIYKELRSRDTAYYSEKYQMHVITRYDDVKFALGNPDIFSSGKGNLLIEDSIRFNKTLGASDNPRHDIYKNIVKNAYSKDNIDRIAAAFSDRARELLSPVDNLNISEIIEDLSATVTAEIINPPIKKQEVKEYVMHIQRHATGAVSENIDDTMLIKFTDLFTDMIVTNKIPSTGPGIYHEYVNNNSHNFVLLPGKLAPSLYIGPAFSGASSLTGSLGILTLDMFRENQIDLVYKDRTLIPALINESLRFHASTGRFSRTVTKDIMLHGVALKEGDRIAVCLESANRDPSVFPEPDRFLVHRDTSGQVAFGHGIHACIALAISKKLMQVWVELLLEIYGRYKVITNNCDLKYVMTSSGNNDMISNIIISPEIYTVDSI
jgi:cytochrome P450